MKPDDISVRAALPLPRRRFLLGVAASAAAPSLPPARRLLARSAVTAPAADVMEQALERMARLAPLGNHGPMAVEALLRLGQAEAVNGWMDGYEKRFTRDWPVAREGVTSANWRSALGAYDRVADWAAFFRAELQEAAWERVLENWATRLAPGLAAAAAHGLIRTGHAVRSLALRESTWRRHELAAGLAYWAASYQTLPDAPKAKAQNLQLAAALERVPHLPAEQRQRGAIVDGLASLRHLPEFTVVGNLLAVPDNAPQFLSELTETFATVYLKNAQARHALALLHAVTGATALRSLLPYLSPSTTRGVLRYGWQLAAAIYSVYGGELRRPLPAPLEISHAELIGRAVAAQDEHAIKFTEACLREYDLQAKPVYLQAAQDAIKRFGVG